MTFCRKPWLILFLGILIVITGGCSTKSAPPPSRYVPTCVDAIDGSFESLSDYDIERILNDTLAGNQMADCWIPVMKQCLDQNREVPHGHLARAVNVFNRFDNKLYFEKSVFRYFSSIDNGAASYRDEDRALLTAYCRYAVRNAASSQDPSVKKAELLARRLDPELFDLMFR